MAAFWDMIGAASMVYWWILVMAPIRSGGPAAYAIRQPVMA